LFINFCAQSSLNSATDCCQTEQQIQQDAWGSARIARVSQQCLHGTVCKCLETNSPNLSEMEISFLGNDTRSYFETFIRSPEQILN